MDNRKILFFILLIAGIIRLHLAWQPVTVLLQKQLSDDAFYYFTIASNFASTGKVSFDGVSITNGFHPLWMLLVSFVYKLFPGHSSLPINVILSLSSIVDVFTVYLVYRIVVVLTSNQKAGLSAALLYCFNPRAIMYSTNGLETSIATFFLALLFFVYILVKDSSSIKAYACFGLIGGLLFLSRTDYIFFFLVFLTHAIYSNRTSSAWSLTVIACSVAFLVALPWLYWNQHTFGNILQVSSSAMPFVINSTLLTSGMTSLEIALHRFLYFVSTIVTTLFYLPILGLFESIPVTFALLWTLHHERKSGHTAFGSQISLVYLLLIGFILLALVHGGIRLYPRGWYFVSIVFVEALFVGVILNYWYDELFTKREGIFIILVSTVIIIYTLSGIGSFDAGYYPWQIEFYDAALWLRDHTLPNATIGAFNSGIIGYYSGHHVVNLDGSVNNQAYHAITERNIWGYIQQQNIDYLADYEYTILVNYRDFYGINMESKLKLNKIVDRPDVAWEDSYVGIFSVVA